MLRFPNPGSTIGNFVAVYTAAFERLQGQVVTLDDLTDAIIETNLATSSGFMGKEAQVRSRRPDRSRDPLYNQLKMYAELFKALGWLHPTERSALNYTFTLLGRQVVAEGPHYLPLLGETVLGITFPTHVLDVKGDHDLRPFSTILQLMLACDGALSRDEMIVVPLSAPTDRTPDLIEAMASRVRSLRASRDSITKAMASLAAARRLQSNTLKNYTRWPIAILRDCGWTEKASLRHGNTGQSFQVHKLTEEGRSVADRISGCSDIRLDQVESLPDEEKAGLSVHAHYQMLYRSGFDLEPVREKLEEHRPAYNSALTRLGVEPAREVLFSPFQSLSIQDIEEIFPDTPATPKPAMVRDAGMETPFGRGPRDHLFVQPAFVDAKPGSDVDEVRAVKRTLMRLCDQYRDPGQAADGFSESRAKDTQTEFYPLVSCLFEILGFEGEYSRAGVNYQRWDAYIWVDGVAVPIEIKSPTEEEYLGTKAIRQALENKVVLLSRKSLSTRREVTSLIVGYKIPNERGELSSLIDDVFQAFGVRIGVIDLRTLSHLAILAITENLTVDEDQLAGLRGFLHV